MSQIRQFIFFIRIQQQDADPNVGRSLYLMIGQMFPLYEAHAAQLTLYLMIGQMFPLYEAHAAQLTRVGTQLST